MPSAVKNFWSDSVWVEAIPKLRSRLPPVAYCVGGDVTPRAWPGG